MSYRASESQIPVDQKSATDTCDDERFQTIFAKNEGAVTAPTSGMHFSRELLKRMEIKGIDSAFITMHCGLGNFRRIGVDLEGSMQDIRLKSAEMCDSFATKMRLF